MKRHAHTPERYPTKEVTVSDLTTVELLWLEKRIENRVRFGRAVSGKHPGPQSTRPVVRSRQHLRVSSVGRPTTLGRFYPASISCERRRQGRAIRQCRGSGPAVRACCDYPAG